MTLVRLLLVTPGLTDAQRDSRLPSPTDRHFPPVEPGCGAGRFRTVDRWLVAPGLAFGEAAAMLDAADPVVEPALADCSLGTWTGASLSDLFSSEPEAVGTWMADPSFAPPGGESMADLVDRVDQWLDAQVAVAGLTVAIVPHGVVRAAILAVLDVGPAPFQRLDITPRSVTELRSDGARWNLRTVCVPL